MSVFHRVADPYSMPGPQYFRFAERLFAYAGVLAARVRLEVHSEVRSEQPEPRPPQHGGDVVEVESTAAAIAASPLGQIVSVAQV